MAHNDKFSSSGLSEPLLRLLSEIGFVEMTPIQAGAAGPLLAGRDLIGRSKTGSGKTAAFILPILHKISLSVNGPQALILCPTRELCEQVLNEARKFSKYLPKIKLISLSGGQPYPPQMLALKNGVHVVVGTPGRTLELLRNRNFDARSIETLVLDEADRLLDEGFSEELNAIVEMLPLKKQTVFFSATFPDSVLELSSKLQTDAIKITVDSGLAEKSSIKQFLYNGEKPDKLTLLMDILRRHPAKCALIFCRTKIAVNEIGEMLKKSGASSAILHADLKQAERDRTTALFRAGQIGILVATDVAARGLDVDALDLVINFDLPSSPEIYIHRIGRTGRAGRAGVAVAIATAYEAELVTQIEALTGVPMIQPTRNLI